MMPGGRMNERNMRLMMKRMGMSTESLEGVEEVIIRRAQDEVVIEEAEVTVVTVQGVKTYQVVGTPKTRARTPGGAGPTAAGPGPAGTPGVAAPPAAPPGPPEEDVQLVMEQGGVDHDAAVRALREANGEPAEAILRLLSRRKA